MKRSYLFVPGNRPERYAKALAAGADAVIIDLEDAVAPTDKGAARDALSGWLSSLPAGAPPVLVRINAAGTDWFDEDLALAGMANVAGVVLPKAESVDDIERLLAAGAPSVLPLIESALGFHHALELARAPKVERLLFGSIDFSVDIGMEETVESLQYFRSQLALVSRLAGIAAPVDGVTTVLDDAERILQDTRRARRDGFGGKLCIHPKQVAAVNAAFMPAADEIAWAERVLEAAAAAQGAAVAVDGRMVDRPVILKAQSIREEARMRQARG
ncbi:HpcH/HpaI aldolase/citrate lyase family protein [Noviherbaspirillum pedocola]|uniref:CoA ester lyase n=1 Tax=Noviherbaspirillum pedocola TaxID=2801341 RepID=A0A934W3T0_9BURK|nr:CoA ester lyase [Noviherbaspirillum pedocola]MBK4733167.1 CoA ester lyase [Noviherbaspirillum pedocola]